MISVNKSVDLGSREIAPEITSVRKKRNIDLNPYLKTASDVIVCPTPIQPQQPKTGRVNFI